MEQDVLKSVNVFNRENLKPTDTVSQLYYAAFSSVPTKQSIELSQFPPIHLPFCIPQVEKNCPPDAIVLKQEKNEYELAKNITSFDRSRFVWIHSWVTY